MKKNMHCIRCDGDGGWIDFDSDENIETFFQCPDCNGTGMQTNKTKKHGKQDTTRSDSKHSIATSARTGSIRKEKPSN